MSVKFNNAFSGIILIIVLLVSCSKNPVTPGEGGNLSGQPAARSVSSPHYCAGLYGLIVDTGDWSVKVVPMRSAELHLNLVGVLNTTMGVGAVGVPSEADPANGLFVLDITLTHPFGTKPQLAGFDVKGILMTAGTAEVNGITFAAPEETHLENADGITRWWNPSEFGTPGMFGYEQGKLTKTPASALTATANGYKYFADILGANDVMSWVTGAPLDADNGRGVFTAGSTNTRRYRIRFEMDPGPQIVFGYAIDAAWNAPSPNPPLEIPDDFPMEANQPEPFYITCQDLGNTLFYDTDTATGGGMARFQVNIHDWQGQSLDDIPSQINSVTVYIPGFSPNTYTGSLWNETEIKARYTVDVTDIVPTAIGTYPVYCFVESSDGSTYEQTMAYAPEDPLTAFAVTTLEVIELPDCLTDDNNNLLEGPEIDLDGQATGSVCLDDDRYDYYSFEIPEGYEASGGIGFYATTEYTILYIYSPDFYEIEYIETDPGYAEFDLSLLSLGTGIYYLAVEAVDYTTDPYFIDMAIDLTEKTDIITLTEVTPDLLSMSPVRCWVESDIAYFIGRTGAWAFDVSTKTAPVLLGHCSFNHNFDVRGAAYYQGHMYFTQYNSNFSALCHVDFTDPSDPVFHGNIFALPGYNVDMAMDSSYLYTCCDDYVVLYDYSAPTLPVQVSTIDFSPNNANEIEIMDPDGTDPHLVVAGDNALISYDISDPLNPLNDGDYSPSSGYFRGIKVRGNYIYININDSLNSAIFIYEQIADDIAYQGAYSFSDYSNYFDVSDNYGVIPHSGSVEVVDITDKTSPSHVGNVTTPGTIKDITVDEGGDYVFFSLGDKGFEIDDISTYPWAGQFASSVINRAIDFTLFEIGANDYLAAVDSESQSNRALRTADITDPSNASVIDSYTLDFSSGNKLGYGNEIIAVTNGTPDFKLISAADPGNLLSTYDGTVPGSAYGYGFYGDTLYVSNLDYGLGHTLEIYDITIPAVPAFIGPFSITDHITSMTFIPDYLFAVQDSEMYIYDITNPVNPTYVDNIVPVTSSATAIEVFGDNLYLLTQTGLEIYDITTPSTPSLLGSVVLYSTGYTLYFDIVEGDYAFIGGSGAGAPIVVDISDTANPHKVMSFDCYSNSVYRIHVLNGYLYASILYDGIRIYRIEY